VTRADALIHGESLRVVGHGSRWDGLEGRVFEIRPGRNWPFQASVTLEFEARDAVRAGITIPATHGTVRAQFSLVNVEPVQEET
jgi:hypothetical protein